MLETMKEYYLYNRYPPLSTEIHSKMFNGCLKLQRERESMALCVITMTLWIFHCIYKMAAKWLMGAYKYRVNTLEKGLVGVLREMEWDSMGFHPCTEGCMFFWAYELLSSRIFYLVVAEYDLLWVAESIEGKWRWGGIPTDSGGVSKRNGIE